LHFNTECDAKAKAKLIPFLMKIAQEESLALILATDFTLKQNEGVEEIQVVFG